jgi:oxaloacetate decarboxylase alpha subunit
MRTGMMLPIADRLDRAGFEAIEIMSSAFYKKCVRDLKDDPWERIRLLAQRIRKTPLRSIRSRSMLAFQITAPAITDLWLERLAANGIQELRTSDPSNTPKYWREAVDGAKRVGLKTILNIIYSISPKHTDAYFIERTRAAAKLDVERICFKDPGGLLTPESTRRLVPLIFARSQRQTAGISHPLQHRPRRHLFAWKRSSSAFLRSTPQSHRWPTVRRIHRCSTWP